MLKVVNFVGFFRWKDFGKDVVERNVYVGGDGVGGGKVVIGEYLDLDIC